MFVAAGNEQQHSDEDRQTAVGDKLVSSHGLSQSLLSWTIGEDSIHDATYESADSIQFKSGIASAQEMTT